MTTTVQQTGKPWKAGQGCGCLVIAIGIVAAFLSTPETSAGPVGWLLGGIFLYLFCRVGAWWNHG